MLLLFVDPGRSARLERNVMGELDMYRQAGTTPNFSDVARRYGMDRHTVAKLWRNGSDVSDGRSEKPSGFDEYREVIAQKASLPGVTKKAIHEYLVDRYGESKVPKYPTLTEYMRKHQIACGTPPDGPVPHPRFETPMGVQLQFDWKEDIRMTDVNGEIFEFNVFSAILGASRLKRYRYSKTKTADDVLACLLDVAVANGGFTETCLTDNMSSLVSFSKGRRKRSERADRFAKEAGTRIEYCARRSPETKGKDESANRFLSRLRAYDFDFDGEDELIAIIANIERRANLEPHEALGVPPAVAFLKEKDYLRPIGNLRALQEMVGDVSDKVVPSTMLVRCRGREWSVPRRCIGKRVRLLAMPGGQLRISMDGRLVALHDMSKACGRINYDPAHYEEALSSKRRYADEDIQAAARENLRIIGESEDAWR